MKHMDRKLLEKLKLGAVGTFSQGKLNKHDEGDLRCAVSIENGTVRIDFGKSIAWVSMPPHQARVFGELLIKQAEIAGDNVRKH